MQVSDAAVRLLRALRAAGWRHSVEHEEGDRDWETGALEGDGYLVHCWTRRDDAIVAWWSLDSKGFIGQIVYGPADREVTLYGPDTRIQVGADRIARHGIDDLHRLAVAAGVLPEAQPQTSSQPAG